jgi:hypothetical protein
LQQKMEETMNDDEIDRVLEQNENEENERDEERRKEEVEMAASPPRISTSPPTKKTRRQDLKNNQQDGKSAIQQEEERKRERKFFNLLKRNKIQLAPASNGTLSERVNQASEAITLHLSHLAHIDDTIIAAMRNLYEVSTQEAISSEMLSLHVPKTILKNRIQQQQQKEEGEISSLAVGVVEGLLRKGAVLNSQQQNNNNNHKDNDDEEEENDNDAYRHTPTFAAHAWELCLNEVVDRAVDRLRLQRLAFEGSLRRTQALKERVLLLSAESKNSTDVLEQRSAALQEKQHDTIRDWHEKRREDLVFAVWDSFSGVRAGLQKLSQHTAKLQAQLPREWRQLQMAADVNEIISAFSVSFNRSQFVLAECLTDEEKEELEKNGRARANQILNQNQNPQQQQQNQQQRIDYFASPQEASSYSANRTPGGDRPAPQQQQQPSNSSPSVSQNLSNAFMRTTPNNKNSSRNNVSFSP